MAGRDYKPHERMKLAQSKRDYALERRELREPSVPRDPAVGVTSMPVKRDDPAIRAMIDEALARRKGA